MNQWATEKVEQMGRQMERLGGVRSSEKYGVKERSQVDMLGDWKNETAFHSLDKSHRVIKIRLRGLELANFERVNSVESSGLSAVELTGFWSWVCGFRFDFFNRGGEFGITQQMSEKR